MKTIKEASKGLPDNRGFKMSSIQQIGEISFKSGVEFAQQLISVKDELPPIKDETYQVLVKDSYGDYNVFEIENYESEKEILEDFELNEITHWRPISFL